MIFFIFLLTIFLFYAFIPSPRSRGGVSGDDPRGGATTRASAGEQAFALIGPRPGNRDRLARRPRAGLVTPRSGGPGLAVRWHYDRLPSMAGRDGDEGWRKLPGSGVPKALRVSCPEAWRSGTEKPPVERREAPSPDRKGEGHASQACRAATLAAQGVSQTPAFLGAPLPLVGGARRGRANLGRRRAARIMEFARMSAPPQFRNPPSSFYLCFTIGLHGIRGRLLCLADATSYG